jgi:hypothetical protein
MRDDVVTMLANVVTCGKLYLGHVMGDVGVTRLAYMVAVLATVTIWRMM